MTQFRCVPNDSIQIVDLKNSKKMYHWKDWALRGVFGFIMIVIFVCIILLGPIALIIMVLLIQMKCFEEIISTVHRIPALSWYFLFTANYFFCGENLVEFFCGAAINHSSTLKFMLRSHRFLSFCLWFTGVVWFVLSLAKKYCKQQFSVLAWTHVTLLIVVTPSHLIMMNIFDGIIWFVVSVVMIVCNDMMAYVFGKWFGKTPLIALSPKKTWEGFIGGGICTVIFGSILSQFLCQWQYFVCPPQFNPVAGRMTMECEPSYHFQLQNVTIAIVSFFYEESFELFNSIYFQGHTSKTLTVYPFVLHSLSLSLFGSIIGPFGGFFASGFKRAFKIKVIFSKLIFLLG